MKASACLSGMSLRQRQAVRASVPHYPYRALNDVPLGPLRAPTTITPPSAMRTSTVFRSEFSSAVGACYFGGRTTVLAEFATTPMSSGSRAAGRCHSSNRVGRESHQAERYVIHAVNEGFHSPPPPSSYRQRFSPGCRQNIARPRTGSPCWTPPDGTSDLAWVSRESTRKKSTSAGFAP